MNSSALNLASDDYRVDLTYLGDADEGARVHALVRASISGRHNEVLDADLEWTEQAAAELDAIARGGARTAFVGSLEDNFELRFERTSDGDFQVVVIPGVVEFRVGQDQMAAFADAFRSNFVRTSAS